MLHAHAYVLPYWCKVVVVVVVALIISNLFLFLVTLILLDGHVFALLVLDYFMTTLGLHIDIDSLKSSKQSSAETL